MKKVIFQNHASQRLIDVWKVYQIGSINDNYFLKEINDKICLHRDCDQSTNSSIRTEVSLTAIRTEVSWITL